MKEVDKHGKKKQKRTLRNIKCLHMLLQNEHSYCEKVDKFLVCEKVDMDKKTQKHQFSACSVTKRNILTVKKRVDKAPIRGFSRQT